MCSWPRLLTERILKWPRSVLKKCLPVVALSSSTRFSDTLALPMEQSNTSGLADMPAVDPGFLPKARGVFIASIDQGTTSTRFIIFDQFGNPHATHQVEFPQYYPHAGWIEHDPYELLQSVEKCIEEGIKKFTLQGGCVKSIVSMGLTTQRETTIVWDTETGKPLHNAIVWSDTRTKKLVHELRESRARGDFEKLHRLSGLPLSTYPSSVKLVWLIHNVPDIQTAYDAGRLAFGTVDSWLIYNLTGAQRCGIHVTDPSHASRTMFMNIETLTYDNWLLEWFGVRKARLPKIVFPSDPDGYGRIVSGSLAGVNISASLGDQSAALVGQSAFAPGMAKNTYGTGCFLLYNTGESPVWSKNGLLTTVGYVLKDNPPVYALEGSIAVAGSAVQFLRDNLGMIENAEDIGVLADKATDNGGVVFVTAFSGLFAPYWIDDCRGTIFGLTQYTRKEHIARATIEATCFQTKAILDAMEKDSGTKLQALAVDGGMSNSDVCMQIQSDVIGINVARPLVRETTALGAAIAAGLANGVWENLNEVAHLTTSKRSYFSPRTDECARQKSYQLWVRAVKMAEGWADVDEV